MASTDADSIQINEIPGKKKVTEDQKNATTEHAVKTWKGMGLDPALMAFGTAMMGTESAFDPHVKGPSRSGRPSTPCLGRREPLSVIRGRLPQLT
ncbi:MAG: hypothetical protein ABSC19_13910 [Syntrophorhabdales bacterium]|jgi:hypothetical protein